MDVLFGNIISSMSITLFLQSRLIPNSCIDLIHKIRSDTCSISSFSYSNTTGSIKNSWLLMYSKNLSVKLPLPFVWKTPFGMCHNFYTCLVNKKEKCFMVPFLWNQRSQSDPLSRRTLITFFLVFLLLVVLAFGLSWCVVLRWLDKDTTAGTAVTVGCSTVEGVFDFLLTV
jgi:hypothetical protein